MNGEIFTARKAIADTIKATFPALRHCETHGGRFSQAELMRWSKRAPAVLIAALRINSLSDDKAQIASVSWGAYIITTDKPEASRDVAALNYAEAITKTVRGNRWDLDCAQRPTNITGDNIFSSELDKHGIAIWAVTWQQGIALSNRDPVDLANWEIYSAEHNVADGPVASDQVDLPQE